MPYYISQLDALFEEVMAAEALDDIQYDIQW